VSEIIEMVYRNGVFKPLRKVRLREGEIVKVEIKETKRVTKRCWKLMYILKRQKGKQKRVTGLKHTS
jgi:predicted DNA-binding antitoxin AbrB/MazE fold protein